MKKTILFIGLYFTTIAIPLHPSANSPSLRLSKSFPQPPTDEFDDLVSQLVAQKELPQHRQLISTANKKLKQHKLYCRNEDECLTCVNLSINLKEQQIHYAQQQRESSPDPRPFAKAKQADGAYFKLYHELDILNENKDKLKQQPNQEPQPNCCPLLGFTTIGSVAIASLVYLLAHHL